MLSLKTLESACKIPAVCNLFSWLSLVTFLLKRNNKIPVCVKLMILFTESENICGRVNAATDDWLFLLPQVNICGGEAKALGKSTATRKRICEHTVCVSQTPADGSVLSWGPSLHFNVLSVLYFIAVYFFVVCLECSFRAFSTHLSGRDIWCKDTKYRAKIKHSLSAAVY